MVKKIIITEEQLKFLAENKGKLFEYYSMVSDPKRDTNILGDIQIWIYGNDRQDFTPHCHVMTKDKSIEIEVSLLDWSIVNVKRPNNLPCNWGSFKMFRKPFFNWLKSTSKRVQIPNKLLLYLNWDENNPYNTLEDYVEVHNEKVVDDDLIKYFDSLKE